MRACESAQCCVRIVPQRLGIAARVFPPLLLRRHERMEALDARHAHLVDQRLRPAEACLPGQGRVARGRESTLGLVLRLEERSAAGRVGHGERFAVGAIGVARGVHARLATAREDEVERAEEVEELQQRQGG